MTLAYVAIIGIAAFAGNMINIGLSYGIHWQSLEPMVFMESFKVDFPLLLVPTAITLMPGFVATLWLIFLNKNNKAARRFWLIAFAGLMLINIQTVAYHLPLNLDFMASRYTALEVTEKLKSWIIFHWIRVAVAIVSGVFAIKAFQASIKHQTHSHHE